MHFFHMKHFRHSRSCKICWSPVFLVGQPNCQRIPWFWFLHATMAFPPTARSLEGEPSFIICILSDDAGCRSPLHHHRIYVQKFPHSLSCSWWLMVALMNASIRIAQSGQSIPHGNNLDLPSLLFAELFVLFGSISLSKPTKHWSFRLFFICKFVHITCIIISYQFHLIFVFLVTIGYTNWI